MKKKKDESKYLILDSANKYEKVWSRIRAEIRRINGGKEHFHEKDYSKIKVDTDDDLLLNKTLKFPTLTVIVRSQICSDECLCEL